MPIRPERGPLKFHVRVWFGHHVIVEQIAEPAMAEQFASAMHRRFASLRVTSEPVVVRTRR